MGPRGLVGCEPSIALGRRCVYVVGESPLCPAGHVLQQFRALPGTIGRAVSRWADPGYGCIFRTGQQERRLDAGNRKPERDRTSGNGGRGVSLLVARRTFARILCPRQAQDDRCRIGKVSADSGGRPLWPRRRLEPQRGDRVFPRCLERSVARLLIRRTGCNGEHAQCLAVPNQPPLAGVFAGRAAFSLSSLQFRRTARQKRNCHGDAGFRRETHDPHCQHECCLCGARLSAVLAG